MLALTPNSPPNGQHYADRKPDAPAGDLLDSEPGHLTSFHRSFDQLVGSTCVFWNFLFQPVQPLSVR